MNWILGKLLPIQNQLQLGLIIVLSGAVVYYAYLAHDRDNLMQIAQAKQKIVEGALETCRFEVDVQNQHIMNNAIDQVAKDEEYAKTMAAKPKWKTKITYVNTGVEYDDLCGVIDEAMKNDTNAIGGNLWND